MGEDERKRDQIRRIQEHDLDDILTVSRTLKRWVEGDEPLTIKQIETSICSIIRAAEDVSARLDFY